MISKLLLAAVLCWQSIGDVAEPELPAPASVAQVVHAHMPASVQAGQPFVLHFTLPDGRDATITITVDIGGEDVPAPQPVNPQPAQDFAAKAQSWVSLIGDSPTKSDERAAAAAVYSLIARDIRDNKIIDDTGAKDVDAIILRTKNDFFSEVIEVGGPQAPLRWEPFTDKLRAALEAMEQAAPNNDLDHATLWLQIATALRKG